MKPPFLCPGLQNTSIKTGLSLHISGRGIQWRDITVINMAGAQMPFAVTLGARLNADRDDPLALFSEVIIPIGVDV